MACSCATRAFDVMGPTGLAHIWTGEEPKWTPEQSQYLEGPNGELVVAYRPRWYHLRPSGAQLIDDSSGRIIATELLGKRRPAGIWAARQVDLRPEEALEAGRVYLLAIPRWFGAPFKTRLEYTDSWAPPPALPNDPVAIVTGRHTASTWPCDRDYSYVDIQVATESDVVPVSYDIWVRRHLLLPHWRFWATVPGGGAFLHVDAGGLCKSYNYGVEAPLGDLRIRAHYGDVEDWLFVSAVPATEGDGG